jgi:hypothetical protein
MWFVFSAMVKQTRNNLRISLDMDLDDVLERAFVEGVFFSEEVNARPILILYQVNHTVVSRYHMVSVGLLPEMAQGRTKHQAVRSNCSRTPELMPHADLHLTDQGRC